MDSKELANLIRRHTLQMANLGGTSHIGSIFSMADIVSVLYGGILNVQPSNPDWHERDRFLLSKGHAGAGVYAVLAELGFFPVKKLQTHCQNGSDLSGHVSHKGVPGVEFSTGSLGQGLSIGTGMAYSAKLDKEAQRCFVLMSDGECDEGSVWEAIMFAAHHKLDNLVAIVDYNKLQSLTTVSATLGLEPFALKWRSFGWHVEEVDGHDHEQLHHLLGRVPFATDKPSCIIAHTVKGKGVSFMENSVLWHYRTPKGDEYTAALKELEGEF